MQHQIANDILIPEFFRLLNEGHEVRFTPTGVSMRPFIEGGHDSVVLRKPAKAPRRGDILLAEIALPGGGKTYVLHRVLRIEDPDGTIILQGDGNLQGEEHVAPDKVLGIVVRIYSPNGRRKPLFRGRLWQAAFPMRWLLLKIYRHSLLKWCY